MDCPRDFIFSSLIIDKVNWVLFVLQLDTVKLDINSLEELEELRSPLDDPVVSSVSQKNYNINFLAKTLFLLFRV